MIKMMAKMMRRIVMRPSIVLPILNIKLIITLLRRRGNIRRCSREGHRGRQDKN